MNGLLTLSIPHGPSRYGPGKVHALRKESQYTYTWCGQSVYGLKRPGTLGEVTCRKCNPSAERPMDSAPCVAGS